MGRKRIYATQDEANAAKMAQARTFHGSFTPIRMPWRVIVDTIIVAVFTTERDARGFAKARYGDDAIVEQRQTRGRYGPCRESGESEMAAQHG